MFTNFIDLSDLPEYKLDTCCVKQLLSITHEIYRYLDHGIEVKSLLLDMSKHLTKFGMKVSYSNYKNGIAGNRHLAQISEISVSSILVQKHLGMLLDTCLTFHDHIKEIIKKTNNTIILLRWFKNFLPRPVLIIIISSYITILLHIKPFWRPMDYHDIVIRLPL